MKVVFEHDLAHNYMIPDYESEYGKGSEKAENEYEIHMLEENHIPGFMACVRKNINGQRKYYYEITSRQSLLQICEGTSLGVKDIKIILRCLYQALQQADQYLLDGNKIVLEPECIYLDIESREAVFCYLPVYEGRIQDSFRRFASFLLYHLNQADTEAVLLVYEINRNVQEKNYALLDILQGEYFKEEIEAEKITVKEHKPLPEERLNNLENKKETIPEKKKNPFKKKNKTRKDLQKDLQKGTTQKDQRKRPGKKWIAAGVFLLVTAITATAAWMGLLTVTQAGGITFLLAGGIGYAVSGRQKGQGAKEKEEIKSEINWEMPEAEEDKEIKIQEPNKDMQTQQNEKNVGATTVLRMGTQEYEPRMTLISMNSRERNSVVLMKDSYLIGKLKAKTDIWIDDEAISRIHAKIQKEGEEYYLYDMNSTNGTFLNGRRLGVNDKVPLHIADEITFAGVGYYVGNC